MYNGQSQGAMNQHNPYPGGQIPPPQGFYSLCQTISCHGVLKN